MDRRTLLMLGAAAMGLAGCTGEGAKPPAASVGADVAVDPDADVRADFAATEVALIAAYRTAIASEPALSEALQPFLDHHVAHLSRVAPLESASPADPPSAGSSAPGGGASAGIAAAQLAELEKHAQAAHLSSCEAARDASLARDLCLAAASEAQHVAVLKSLVRAQENP